MIKIDGITYNVPNTKIRRKASFLDKYAERLADGDLDRQLIGVFFNYTMDFGLGIDPEEYDRLYQKLTEPTEYHTVEVPTATGSLTYKAYFGEINDELLKQANGKNYFGNLSVSFISKMPNRK